MKENVASMIVFLLLLFLNIRLLKGQSPLENLSSSNAALLRRKHSPAGGGLEQTEDFLPITH